MIQALMLVSLGFFAASLLALLVAPAAWARAVRLTSHRIRSSLPINETEIRAEKDQLRATHAVVVHQLEKKIERAEMSAARQRVELNRRNARINDLEEASGKLTAELDENRNARHVLAQTLNERLPRAEERLRDARELLKARDAQVAKFVQSATKQHAAISQATAMIRQMDEEKKRLQVALAARQSAGRQRVPAGDLEQTMALQSEVLELRDRAASQSKLIERIQEVERTELQAGDPGAGWKLTNGSSNGEQPFDHVPASDEAELPEHGDSNAKGFAARFNHWRLALMKEKETTARLRTELANAHDRSAKLSAGYRDQLRSLSQSGAVSATSEMPYGDLTPPSSDDFEETFLSPTSQDGNGGEPPEYAEASDMSQDIEQAPAAHVADNSETFRETMANRIGERGAAPARGSLTERIKRQETTDEVADETLAPIVAKQRQDTGSVKSGTLLQRLKGMESG